MKKMSALILSFALMGTMAVAQAGDAAAGKAKSTTCMGCHGAKGVSANPMWPNLAGQKDAYLIKQMKDFRDGKRKDAMMAPMAKGLSDTDIVNIAAYYSKLK